LINQCRSHGQKRSRWLRIFSRSPSSESEDANSDNPPVDSQVVEPLERMLAAERAALLAGLLAELPVAQSDALRLRFFGELKFQEIADATGCSLLTAKNRVRLGLLRLSQLISARGAIAQEQVDGLFIPPSGRNRA
jgi:RNA polymerase sigma-70 factor (ECF subfamily)